MSGSTPCPQLNVFFKRKKICRMFWRFQVILNFFPQKHTFKIILNLLICISKSYEKNTYFLSVSAENRFLSYGRGGGVRKLRTSPQLLGVFLRLSYEYNSGNFMKKLFLACILLWNCLVNENQKLKFGNFNFLLKKIGHFFVNEKKIKYCFLRNTSYIERGV